MKALDEIDDRIRDEKERSLHVADQAYREYVRRPTPDNFKRYQRLEYERRRASRGDNT